MIYRVNGIEVSETVYHYLIAALWSSTDESDEKGGNPIDDNFTIHDIEPETIREAIRDCAYFEAIAGEEVLEKAMEESGQGYDHIGHNFWLTRNHHGAGFWDGDYPETGDRLTSLAEKFPEVNPFVDWEAGTVYFDQCGFSYPIAG